MAFKLGKEGRGFRTPKDTPIFKKNLRNGVKAEANKDGSIFVDHSVNLNSKQGQKIVAHEMQHIKDMKSGKASYGDDYVRWSGTTYPREGNKIQYKGKWYLEGDKNLPWEKSAIKAEKNV